MQNINTIISNLTTLLAQTAEGKYAITLAGSHAKGGDDLHSDIVFLFSMKKLNLLRYADNLLNLLPILIKTSTFLNFPLISP